MLAGLLIVVGVRSAARLPLDAFPDTTPVQVQINTVAPELSPEEVERLITFPVEYAMGGLEGLEEVRSVSKFGFSQVVAIFEDGTDIYFARQQINERLGEAKLPEGIERPTMGPVATGLGEVYHYLLTSENPDDRPDRASHAPGLGHPAAAPAACPVSPKSTPGAGYEKQFEVQADPAKLAKHGLTLDDLMRGPPAEQPERRRRLRRPLRARRASFTASAARPPPSRSRTSSSRLSDGVPIRVRDVAEVEIGHAIRRGGVTAEGKGEAVLGLAFMRMGENSREVTNALDRAMDEVKRTLPARRERRGGLQADRPRSPGARRPSSGTSSRGPILVIAVLFAFLGNFRAGLIVASAIPLSMLFAVTMMERIGIAGSLMSLGAIDFGLVVDSSVVMVENCVRRLAHDRSNRPKLAIIRDAAVEVRKPTMFGELIIMIVYLPILTLEGHRGEALPADGLDGHLRPRRLARPVAHAHARPRLARAPAEDVREGDVRRPHGPPALPAAPSAGA